MDTTLARRWRVPALIAALTALVVAAVWALSPAGRGGTPGAAATNPSASHPPKLVFQGGAALAPALRAAAGTADSASGSKIAAARGAYILEGTLGTGPRSSAVYRLATPTSEQVARLAAALGLPAPKRTADGWTATDKKHELHVQSAAGGNWYYGMAPECGPVAVEADTAAGGGAGDSATSYGCAVAASGVAVATPVCGDAASTCLADDSVDYVEPKTADDATVRKAAAAILAGANVQLEGARVSVQYGSISVDPLVRNLPTSGLQTSVSVDLDGNVQWANGWLGAVVEGDTYPLITAAQAFTQLQDQPQMGIMRCMPPDMPSDMESPATTATNGGIVPPDKTAASKPGAGASVSGDPGLVDPAVDGYPCGNYTPEPVTVTGATFGLSTQWLVDNAVLLAPSWLFTMKGSEQWPMPVLAIDPSYLGLPEPGEIGSIEPMPAEIGPATSSPANSGGGATAPGATPAEKGAMDPAGPSTTPSVKCNGGDVCVTG